MSTVLVLGSFDILHYGHIEFLNRAAALGDVWIGLGTDEYQSGYKRTPVQNYEELARALRALGYNVVERGEKTIEPLLDALRPDYLAAGMDWIELPFLTMSGITPDDLAERDIALVFLPPNKVISTTAIMERIIDEHLYELRATVAR